MAISGFFLRFALVSREVADGTAFVLALQLWPWRSDDGGLWINLTTTLCLCVCVYMLVQSIIVWGRKWFWDLKLTLATQS